MRDSHSHLVLAAVLEMVVCSWICGMFTHTLLAVFRSYMAVFNNGVFANKSESFGRFIVTLNLEKQDFISVISVLHTEPARCKLYCL